MTDKKEKATTFDEIRDAWNTVLMGSAAGYSNAMIALHTEDKDVAKRRLTEANGVLFSTLFASGDITKYIQDGIDRHGRDNSDLAYHTLQFMDDIMDYAMKKANDVEKQAGAKWPDEPEEPEEPET